MMIVKYYMIRKTLKRSDHIKMENYVFLIVNNSINLKTVFLLKVSPKL